MVATTVATADRLERDLMLETALAGYESIGEAFRHRRSHVHEIADNPFLADVQAIHKKETSAQKGEDGVVGLYDGHEDKFSRDKDFLVSGPQLGISLLVVHK